MEDLRPDDPRELGAYQIEGRLGAGGFGVVFAAVSSDGRPVAVKVLRSELSDDSRFRQRLGREGQALKRIEGARVAKVIDVVVDAPAAYLVMELIEGGNLEEHVRETGPLSGPLLWVAAQGLAEALADIHAGGIIHRDLKPSNVMYGPDGVKVLDFGISVAAEDTGLTETGAFVGTAAWISPEQVNGDDVSTKTDVFGLGLVLAFAATGEHPYGSGRSDAVMYRITNNDPDLSSVPDQLRPTLELCLQRDPALRPSVEQLLSFFGSNGNETFSDPTSATLNVGFQHEADSDTTNSTRAVDSPFDSSVDRSTSRRLVISVAAAILAVGVVAIAVIMPRGNDENLDSQPQTSLASEELIVNEPIEPSSSSTTDVPGATTTIPVATTITSLPPVTTTEPENRLVPPSTPTTTTPSNTPNVQPPPQTGPPAQSPSTQGPTGPVAILTGQSIGDENNRPALLAKIDNAEAARPQNGINKADVVFETLVEGNMTRFSAVFQSQDAGSIGPIRSIRKGDFNFVSNLNFPLFVHSGGNGGLINSLDNMEIVRADFLQLPGVYYRENAGRPAPHNLLTYTKGLYQYLGFGGQKPPALFVYRLVGEQVDGGVRQVLPVTINFGGNTVTYTWDASLKGWLRKQNGTTHKDHLGQSVAPANVVIQFTNYNQDLLFPYSPDPILIGEGEAWVLTGGKLIIGTWSRTDANTVTTYETDSGHAIRLTPGRTWVAFPRPGTASR